MDPDRRTLLQVKLEDIAETESIFLSTLFRIRSARPDDDSDAVGEAAGLMAGVIVGALTGAGDVGAAGGGTCPMARVRPLQQIKVISSFFILTSR